MGNVVEVKFDFNNSCSFFRNNKFDLSEKPMVIVNTDKGLQLGKVIKVYDDDSRFSDVDIYEVMRIANKKDYSHYLENHKLEDRAVVVCKKFALKNDLKMKILDAHYSYDRTHLLFRFVADERIDFRKLAKELGAFFHVRIELRQIGIRDKAKEIGGLGPCGRLLCCSSFLKSFDSVSINMAKNQNVSLSPSKINGVCGRLLCCLKYENEGYLDVKKNFPKVGSVVELPDGKGKGKVLNVNVIRGVYTAELENRERIEVKCFESKE